VAILWPEQWHEGLEEASRLYFADGNIQGMLDVLLPLHDTLSRGATTLREASFLQAFGRELADAHQQLKRYADACVMGALPRTTIYASVYP
jgi:FKBP12-rapamycin complex-associated protein